MGRDWLAEVFVAMGAVDHLVAVQALGDPCAVEAPIVPPPMLTDT